jgi:hypothetical protein
MTNKEALLAVLQDVTVPDLTADKVLLDANITGTDIYVSGSAKQIDLCAIELLYGLYTSPDVGEGGYSVSHPDFLRKIEKRLLYLAKKHGVEDNYPLERPTVKDASNRW